MRSLVKGLLAPAFIVVATIAASGYGYDGSLNAIDSALNEGVASNNASAIKMRGFVRKESDALSKDFGTLSKVVKEAEKGDFAVLDDEFLAGQFGQMSFASAEFGLAAFQRLSNAAGGDPKKLTKILKANVKYIAKQAKTLQKYNEVWGDPEDESKINLAKAAGFYGQVQKLYELINKVAAKYEE